MRLRNASSLSPPQRTMQNVLVLRLASISTRRCCKRSKISLLPFFSPFLSIDCINLGQKNCTTPRFFFLLLLSMCTHMKESIRCCQFWERGRARLLRLREGRPLRHLVRRDQLARTEPKKKKEDHAYFCTYFHQTKG